MLTQPAPIGVFLLDDHDLVRKSVADLLETEPDIRVVSESATAVGVLPAIAATRPSVAVLDVRLQDGNGIEVCREIRTAHPSVRCLMLTSFSDDRAIVDAALAGADGFVLKQVRGNQIVESVRALAAGQQLLDPSIVEASLERLRATEQQTIASLSPQEVDLFDRIGQGHSNTYISSSLGKDLAVVRNEIASMLRKLGMVRRTEASDAFRRWHHA